MDFSLRPGPYSFISIYQFQFLLKFQVSVVFIEFCPNSKFLSHMVHLPIESPESGIQHEFESLTKAQFLSRSSIFDGEILDQKIIPCLAVLHLIRCQGSLCCPHIVTDTNYTFPKLQFRMIFKSYLDFKFQRGFLEDKGSYVYRDEILKSRIETDNNSKSMKYHSIPLALENRNTVGPIFTRSLKSAQANLCNFSTIKCILSEKRYDEGQEQINKRLQCQKVSQKDLRLRLDYKLKGFKPMRD